MKTIVLVQVTIASLAGLAETCFQVTEQYASDKTNVVNNALSCYIGSTVQCFLCCYCLPVI